MDLSAASSEAALLQETNKLLGQRVVELEAQMGGGKTQGEVQLELQLQQVCESREEGGRGDGWLGGGGKGGGREDGRGEVMGGPRGWEGRGNGWPQRMGGAR